MPIEIKELHIKAVVGNSREQSPNALKPEDIVKLKRELFKDIVDKVFELLKKRTER